jgi:CDP-glycerol glycerophosphotransferase
LKKLKVFILNYSKKHIFFRKILRKTRLFQGRIKYLFYYILFPVDDKLIFFQSFNGNSFSCSPKAIYNYLLNNEKYKDYKFVWAFKDLEKDHMFNNSPRTVIVKTNSFKYYYYLSKSKYWIVNSLLRLSVIKKKKQIYVQCWHGTPLKKLRCDINVTGGVLNTTKEIVKRNNLDAKKFDYFISPSKYATEKFISAFNLKKLNKEKIIIEKGYPRNDKLSNYNNDDIDKIKNKLNIPKNKKVILYAPTFRDDEHTSGVGYTYKLNINFDSLQKELKNYITLFRAHYFVANSFDFDKYKGFIYDVSKYDDINDLYIISDLLITDYSSVFFDYAILNRPIIFYMYDYDNYKNNLRDFYIDLKELPGPIVKEEKDLIPLIKENNNKKYKNMYTTFNKKFNPYEDGKSTERVVKEILK